MSKKMLKLITSLTLVISLFLGSSFSSLAIDVEEETSTETVTLHKILQSKDDMNAQKDVPGSTEGDTVKKDVFPGTTGIDGTKYNGDAIQNLTGYFGESAKEIAGVYFAVKYASGTNAGKFVTYDATNQIFGAADTVDAENVLGGLTNKDGIVFNTAELAGDFEIVEVPEKSTYKGTNGEQLAASKAVPVKITLPLVNENGIVVNAHVYPKNTEDKPKIDKNFGFENNDNTGHNVVANGDVNGAINGATYDNYAKKKATIDSEIGKEIPYEVKTEIPKDAKYKTIVWQDTMTKGLDYVLKSMTITTTPDLGLVATTDYVLTETTKGFELKLTDAGLQKVEEAAKNSAVTFVLKYKGKITKDAVIDSPETNDVKLIYSNEKKENLTPKDVKPSNKEIKVTKTWDTTPAPTGVEVTYTLYEVAQNGELVFVNKVDLKGPSYDHTFTGLDDNKTYRVIESVKGYVPEYTSSGAGSLSLKNTNTPSLTPEPPKVVTYGKKFVKTNDADKAQAERLAGAEFVVKNKAGKYLAKKDDAQKAGDLANYNNTEKNYQDALKELSTLLSKNELTSEEQERKTMLEGTEEGSIKVLKETRDNAYAEAYFDYVWVDNKEAENVVKLVSDAEGRFEITGIQAGDYFLEEITPPAGYAKLSGDQEFTVGAGTYKGDPAEMEYNKANADNGYGKQIKNMKVSIPQTGGMGTILFTVIGLAIMAFALISLRRKKNEA